MYEQAPASKPGEAKAVDLHIQMLPSPMFLMQAL